MVVVITIVMLTMVVVMAMVMLTMLVMVVVMTMVMLTMLVMVVTASVSKFDPSRRDRVRRSWRLPGRARQSW